MFSLKSKWIALLCSAALIPVGALHAQDSKALLDVLIKKGILTSAEAQEIQKEASASAAKSKTTIGGKLYFDVSSIDAKTSTGSKNSASGFGADVKRFYVQVDHSFDKVWKASIKTDAGYSSSTGTTALFIKSAYVQATLSPEAIFQIGSSDMPWIPFDEGLYGLRYVENTLADRDHVGNSADWGLHFLGKNGMVSYNFAMVNGGGYKNPTRSKSMDFEGRVSIEPVKGLTAAIGAYSGKLGKDFEGVSPTRNATRFNALLAYVTPDFRVGGELYTQENWGKTTGTVTDKGDGMSLWTTVHIDGPYSVFARYDSTKPSKTVSPNLKQDYFNLGFQWAVIKGLDLALVYKHAKVDNPTSASTVTDYNEFGMFGQVAF